MALKEFQALQISNQNLKEQVVVREQVTRLSYAF